jgi:tetratricopeptide (TPR) repeat protein
MQPLRFLVLGWLVVALLASSRGIRADARGLFEAEMAEGLWFLSQDDAFDAAQHFKRASDLDPEDGFPLYLLGLSHLRQGKAPEAVAEIGDSLNPKKVKKLPPVEPSRVLADRGAAELDAGLPQDAARTLEEALRGREGSKDYAIALFHYGKALNLLGREEEAQEAFAAARRLRPELDPEDLPVELPDLTAQASDTGRARPWEGNADFLVGYDSNPNLLSKDLFLPNPSSETELVSGAQSDSVANAYLQATYAPQVLPPGWSLAVDLRGVGALHKEFSYLNLVGSGAVIQVAHGDDPRGFLEGPLGYKRVSPGPASRYSLLLQGGVDQLRLDGAPYLRSLAAAGSMVFSPSDLNATQVALRAQSLNYFHHPLADPRRSGTEVGLAVRQIHFRDRPRNSFVAVGIFAGQRNAGSAFDRSALAGDFEMSLPLAPRWQLDWTVAAGREDFEHSESNLFASAESAPKRKDTTWGGEATLTFDMTNRLRFLVRGVYQRRNSNITFSGGLPALDYQRTLVETGLSWVF